MFEGMQKKLIIVGEEKTDVYCEYLSMLISSNDDIRDENGELVDRIGPSDGTIDSAIWTDKIYLDNRCHTSSKQKFLFIGDSKATENIAPNIVCFDENDYGIIIGWLGNKAVINIDVDAFKNEKNKELYKDFYEEYVSLVMKYNSKLFNITEEEQAKYRSDRVGESIDRAKHIVNVVLKKDDKQAAPTEVNEKAAKGVVVAASVAGASALAPSVSIIAPPMILASLPILYDIKENKSNLAKIKEQQYRYAVLKFYLDYFNAFMEY